MGCAAQKPKTPGIVVEEDVAAVVKLPDGSTCTEPASMDAARQLPGALQVKEMFDSAEPPETVLEQAKKAKVTDQEVEAAWFDVCRAFSKRQIKNDVLEKNRKIYLELRQTLLDQGIKDWVARKEGINEAGKLCMTVFDADTSSARNTTRKVPDTTTVDDCALLAQRAGSSEILLGCTEGQWKNHWAKKTVAAGPVGMKSRGKLVRDTALAPDPNCGWL
jgi:hypothetical protein